MKKALLFVGKVVAATVIVYVTVRLLDVVLGVIMLRIMIAGI